MNLVGSLGCNKKKTTIIFIFCTMENGTIVLYCIGVAFRIEIRKKHSQILLNLFIMDLLLLYWQSSSSLVSNGQSLMPLQRKLLSIHGPFSHRNIFTRQLVPTKSSSLFIFLFFLRFKPNEDEKNLNGICIVLNERLNTKWKI